MHYRTLNFFHDPTCFIKKQSGAELCQADVSHYLHSAYFFFGKINFAVHISNKVHQKMDK